MIKLLQILSFCFAIILTIIAGFIFVKRLMLPYNAEGNYFDPVNSINYHQQAVVGYGILFGICLLITIGLLLSIVKLSSKKKGLDITFKETKNEL